MTEKGLYFISIIPPSPIKEEVFEMKEQVSSKFNSHAALRSPPHITLHMPFQYRTDRIEKIIERLEGIPIKPFEVELNNFSGFPPRVIYVDVLPSHELEQLYLLIGKRLRPLIQKDPDYKGRGFTPHMTIAFRDLKKNLFQEALTHFKKISYQRKWRAKEFHLLKHQGKKWEECIKFKLDS